MSFEPRVIGGGGNGGPAEAGPYGRCETRARGIGAWFLIIGVHFYRAVLSPFLGGNCKFYPSCSHYAEEAVRVHGARRGSLLAMKRLLRCRPFTKGGYDPVPSRGDLEFTSSLHGQEPSR